MNRWHPSGIEREARPFAPHVTVARAKVEAPNPGLRGLIEGRSKVEFGEQMVKSIRLKKSVLTKCGTKIYYGRGSAPQWVIPGQVMTSELGRWAGIE